MRRGKAGPANDLEGQAERLELDSQCRGKPLGAFKGGSTRATIKMAPAVEKRMGWRSARGCSHHGCTALLSLIRGTAQTGMANKTVACHEACFRREDPRCKSRGFEPLGFHEAGDNKSGRS